MSRRSDNLGRVASIRVRVLRRRLIATAVLVLAAAATGAFLVSGIASGARPARLMEVKAGTDATAHGPRDGEAASGRRFSLHGASSQSGKFGAGRRNRPSSRSVPRKSEPDAREATSGEGGRFGGRRIRKVREMWMLVTAYSPDERSCGRFADGQTASGYSVWTNGMKLVAADTDLLPFGTVLTVPGYHGGKPVPVLDRGSAIQGRRLDVLFPTHSQAMAWGRQWIKIGVWKYVDGEGGA
jgi:3D (Asp-Asp-Asp) domain-containing protein